MAKKETNSTTKKWYFSNDEENAVVKYIETEDPNERERVFNETLLPAFNKMAESIIRRYKLYTPDETFQEIFDDAMSFLITKLEKFNPTMGYKAYSYCGTIIKNYLIYRSNQYIKNQKRFMSYDSFDAEQMNGISNTMKYSSNTGQIDISFFNDLMKRTADNIQKTIDNKDEKLNEKQIRVGKALIDLLTNWEDVFTKMGSDKFNKSSILLFLKESTNMTTKEIRDNMKIFKNQYYLIKNDLIS